ncbi:hypothetical protein KSS87_005732 [Heliosperma pusillum]|nr:hypothetical protein KSS87_005732 [Heliosperma pusillum]
MVETKPKPDYNSSDAAVDSDLPGEDSWVVVKKQKLTILIPNTTTDITNAPPQLPHQKPPHIPLSSESDGQSGKLVYMPPEKPISKPATPNMDSRENNFEDQYGVLRPLCRKKTSRMRLRETAHSSSKAFVQPGKSTVNLRGCTTVLNSTLRASNMKIKIVRAGGLRRWLSSLGLEQFQRIFRRTNGNKFLWGNLSMDKLKKMGYNAVGPRRKLIHAIECPY